MRKPPPYLLIVIARLVVVVGLEGQLGVALCAPEAAAVEEGVVLEGPDLVRRVDHLATAQAVAVHVVRLEHGEAGSRWARSSVCWHFCRHRCHLQKESQKIGTQGN